jgi:predicted DNA-binding transcriptional regulator AlpA
VDLITAHEGELIHPSGALDADQISVLLQLLDGLEQRFRFRFESVEGFSAYPHVRLLLSLDKFLPCGRKCVNSKMSQNVSCFYPALMATLSIHNRGLMNKKTLTITQLAVYLGESRSSLYRKIADGRFPVKPIKGTKPRRWAVESVDAWRLGA